MIGHRNDACPLPGLQASVTWKFNRFLSSSSKRNFRRMFSALFFFLFRQKQSTNIEDSTFSFFSWLMYLALSYNWEVQESFLHNPLSLKSVYHLFLKMRLFDMLKNQNKYEIVQALISFEFWATMANCLLWIKCKFITEAQWVHTFAKAAQSSKFVALMIEKCLKVACVFEICAKKKIFIVHNFADLWLGFIWALCKVKRSSE